MNSKQLIKKFQDTVNFQALENARNLLDKFVVKFNRQTNGVFDDMTAKIIQDACDPKPGQPDLLDSIEGIFSIVSQISKQLDTDDDRLMCDICLQDCRSIVFTCGHTCCHACYGKIGPNCHSCRERIKRSYQIRYMPHCATCASPERQVIFDCGHIVCLKCSYDATCKTCLTPVTWKTKIF